MGYNGSNRRFRSSMISKSSTRKGNSLLFGRKGIATGLFDIGGAIVKDVANSSVESKTLASDNPDSDNGTFKGCAIITIVVLAIIGIWLLSINLPFLGILALLIPVFAVKDVLSNVFKAKKKGRKHQ